MFVYLLFLLLCILNLYLFTLISIMNTSSGEVDTEYIIIDNGRIKVSRIGNTFIRLL